MKDLALKLLIMGFLVYFMIQFFRIGAEQKEKRIVQKQEFVEYVDSLREQGFSDDWAYEKAMVELGHKKPGLLYYSIQED